MRDEIDNVTEDQLTHALNSLTHEQHLAPEYLVARVINRLANLPAKREPFDLALAWFQETLWRGALAAVLPILLGVAVGSVNLTEQDEWNEAEMWVFADVLEEYDDYEIPYNEI